MTRMLLPVLLALLGCTDTAAPAASYKATPPETGRWLGCSAFETPRGVVAVDRWAPVWFDPGSAQIKARDMATLDYFVSSYDGPADCLIVVSGHSDLAESAPRDLSLSRRRAEAVAKYLRRKGLAATIRIDPLGGTHPLVQTPVGVAEAQNRWVLVWVEERPTSRASSRAVDNR